MRRRGRDEEERGRVLYCRPVAFLSFTFYQSSTDPPAHPTTHPRLPINALCGTPAWLSCSRCFGVVARPQPASLRTQPTASRATSTVRQLRHYLGPFSRISQLSATSRAPCSMHHYKCPCVLDADGSLQSDVVPNSRPQATTTATSATSMDTSRTAGATAKTIGSSTTRASPTRPTAAFGPTAGRTRWASSLATTSTTRMATSARTARCATSRTRSARYGNPPT